MAVYSDTGRMLHSPEAAGAMPEQCVPGHQMEGTLSTHSEKEVWESDGVGNGRPAHSLAFLQTGELSPWNCLPGVEEYKVAKSLSR